MVTQANTFQVRLEDYSGIVPDQQLERAASLATGLKGARVIHISSTARGGGIAELLKTLVPLMRSVGVSASWYVLPSNQAFFQATKHIHDHLQGLPGELEESAWHTYENYIQSIADDVVRAVGGSADVWILHDTHPIPLVSLLPSSGKRVWVCHVDTSSPNPLVVQRLLPWVRQYSRVVFSSPDYVLESLLPSQVSTFSPAIDPLTLKNRGLIPREARYLLSTLGLDISRPIITQVTSRFDQWKDPLGVIQAYFLVKKQMPQVQLALVGGLDTPEDPEAIQVFQECQRAVQDDPDAHLFTDMAQIGDREVAAFQQVSNVVIQKSLKEGFGLTVTEALWKANAVVGGNCSGIRLQIQNSVNGYLVNSVEECAQRTLELLANQELARAMGQKGRELVRQRFLSPRLLVDYLQLLTDLLGPAPDNGQGTSARQQPRKTS